MKISIIGGGGLVGSCAAFALQARDVGREIALIDVNPETAAGHALDLQHGSPSTSNQFISAGGYEHIPASDLICITAGLRRQPGESRLDLINRNTDLFLSILDQIKLAGHQKTAMVLVVSNPVDILTYVAAQQLELPSSQIIGLGTQLDSIRFRSLIARHLQVAPKQISALILGEHGDSMVPIWSSATFAGLPLAKHPLWKPADPQKIFDRTKGSGAEVIKKKGGAGFAVGVAIADVAEAVFNDLQIVLPVSSYQDGSCYGIREVSLSVPTVVGRAGVIDKIEVELWAKEMQALRTGANVLRKTLDNVVGRFAGIG
jgi:L-lactate dehydrogenase